MTARDLFALEWRRLRRENLYWIALCLCVAALIYGLSNGLAWRKFQEDGIRRAATIGAEGIAAAKAKAAGLAQNPGETVDFWIDPRTGIGFEGEYLRLYDCLPPAPLSVLGTGQSDLLPYCVRVVAGPWPSFLPSHEWENPLRLLLGRFDCAFVIIYLLPLLALLVSFNLLAREREQGTLLLLFSYPVEPQRWLAVCFLLRAGIFLGVILGVLTAGLFLLGFDPAAPGALTQLALWLAITLAYGAFWFALAFAAGAFGVSSETNALVLVSAWLTLVILMPAGLNLALKQIYPLPSRAEYIDTLRAASAEAENKGSGLLQKFLYDHPDLAPGNEKETYNGFIATLIAVNAETGRILDPLKQRFQTQNDRQTGVIQLLGLVSPAIVFQQASNTLTGSGQTRHRQFMDAVEAHTEAVKRFLGPSFVNDVPFLDYDGIPSFMYEENAASLLTWSAVGGLAVLTALGFVLGAMGWRVLRQPVLER